jgi:hypothetical protein
VPKCINLLITGIKREFGQKNYLQNSDKTMQYACFQTVWRTVSYDTEYRRTTHKTSINSTWLIEHFKILDTLICVFNYFKTKSEIVTCVGLNCKFDISFFNDVWYQRERYLYELDVDGLNMTKFRQKFFPQLSSFIRDDINGNRRHRNVYLGTNMIFCNRYLFAIQTITAMMHILLMCLNFLTTVTFVF